MALNLFIKNIVNSKRQAANPLLPDRSKPSLFFIFGTEGYSS